MSAFWSLRGKFTDPTKTKVAVDFSPKGGPADLAGAYAEGKLTWPDGNSWRKVELHPRKRG